METPNLAITSLHVRVALMSERFEMARQNGLVRHIRKAQSCSSESEIRISITIHLFLISVLLPAFQNHLLKKK